MKSLLNEACYTVAHARRQGAAIYHHEWDPQLALAAWRRWIDTAHPDAIRLAKGDREC